MKTLTLAGLLLAASAPAFSQSGQDEGMAGPKKMFERLDANENGIVTHEEFMAHNVERFSEYDADSDGYLTLEELPQTMQLPPHVQKRLAARQERMQNRMERRGLDLDIEEVPERARRMRFMARLDKDGDERLSVEEFAAPPLKRFKFADVNGDGEVTEGELDTALAERMRKPHGRRMR